MTVDERLQGPGPKRILSLDGGGVRGLISLGMLARIEDILRARRPEAAQRDFRLCEYFDLIGGTSTGALIAVQLAMGETVAEITARYREMCPKIFTKTRWLRYIDTKLDSKAFENYLKDNFRQLLIKHGHQPNSQPTLSSGLLKTGLAVVTKRIDTGSVWVLTNNPRHKFWDRNSPHWRAFWDRTDPALQFYANGSYDLELIVRASASAPFFLNPVPFDIAADQTGLFLDGGASPFNDPAAELLMMAALGAAPDAGNGDGLSPHGFGWPTGADNIFMVSIGTGHYRIRHKPEDYKRMSAVVQAVEALRGIIADAQKSTQTWMNALSVRPRAGEAVDMMHTIDFNLGAMAGLTLGREPLLTYRRFNPTIEPQWMTKHLGSEFTFGPKVNDRLKEMDRPEKDHHKRCYMIGERTGAVFIDPADFPARFDPPGFNGQA